MTLLRDVFGELFGMFVADARLTVAILCVVAVSAALMDLIGAGSLVGGGVLLLGCLGVLVGAVRLGARPK